MRSFTLILVLAVTALAGCESSAPIATVRWAPSGNVLLSRNPQLQTFASQNTSRVNWPSMQNGYQFQDVETFTVFEYDDQFFRDGFGGSFYRTTESIRSGVRVR